MSTQRGPLMVLLASVAMLVVGVSPCLTSAVAGDLDPSADLTVDLSDLADPVESGGSVDYLTAVTSAGPDLALNAILRFFVHPEEAFDAITLPTGPRNRDQARDDMRLPHQWLFFCDCS